MKEIGSDPNSEIGRTMSKLQRTILAVAVAVVAAAPARSTILFRPVGQAPKVMAYQTTTTLVMSQPLTSTDAVQSPKLHFVFVGSKFVNGTGGPPTEAANAMIAGAKAIVSSSYLSGLTQYGSDGKASFDDALFDPKTDPTSSQWTGNLPTVELGSMFTQHPSWLPPTPVNCQTPVIYVVVHYPAPGVPSHGENTCGPAQGYAGNVKILSIKIDSNASNVDTFTWLFSHELAESMTGSVREISPGDGQICDGEPESGNNYEWRLNGGTGPQVTSYWSFLDQAYIIPDGTLNRVLLVPVWNRGSFTHTFLSLQQGTLYSITTPDQQKTPIDSGVQSFVVNLDGGIPRIYDLTASGQVKYYNGSPGSWMIITPPSTVATALVSTSTPATGNDSTTLGDGQLFMLAGNQVMIYTGGNAWLPFNGFTSSVVSYTGIAAANGYLYLDATGIGGPTATAVESFGYSTNATLDITNSKTSVLSIASVGGSLYMLAAMQSQGTYYLGISRWDSSTSTWQQVTDPQTVVWAMAAAGDNLIMIGSGADVAGGSLVVAAYGLKPFSWIPLTGTNTRATQILTQDGSELYMVGFNTGEPSKVWQYNSSPLNWTALTDGSTNVKSASVSNCNTLSMEASISGGSFQNYNYLGTPLDWTTLLSLWCGK